MSLQFIQSSEPLIYGPFTLTETETDTVLFSVNFPRTYFIFKKNHQKILSPGFYLRDHSCLIVFCWGLWKFVGPCSQVTLVYPSLWFPFLPVLTGVPSLWGSAIHLFLQKFFFLLRNFSPHLVIFWKRHQNIISTIHQLLVLVDSVLSLSLVKAFSGSGHSISWSDFCFFCRVVLSCFGKWYLLGDIYDVISSIR